MEFKETKDKLVIELISQMKPIVKFGFILQGVIAIGTSLLLLIQIFTFITDFRALFFIPFFIVSFLGGRKYLRTVFHKEILEVTKKQLTIIDQYLLSKKTETFSISRISNIEFIGQQNFTKHPLGSETVDYTGLVVTEREVQYMISDGTIGIFHNGVTRRFGKNLSSWDAEEIVTRIAKFTGNDLSLDDEMEKLLDDLDKSNLED